MKSILESKQVKISLKQGEALSPLLFHFALVHATCHQKHARNDLHLFLLSSIMSMEMYMDVV